MNTRLQELFSVVEESGKTLLAELKTALGPTVRNLVPYNLQQVIKSPTVLASTCPRPRY